MANANEKLRILRNELQFLDTGGYGSPILWRAARIFEDSPTCTKDRWFACPHGDCALLDFVPEERRQERIPCRHILLNDGGETLTTLYNTGTNEETHQIVREWLQKTIAGLEATKSEMIRSAEKAS